MKFLFAGDFHPRTDCSKKIIKDGQFESIMKEVIPVVGEADFSIVNFESPIANPLTQKPFIPKGVKSLCCEKEALACVKSAGFDMVALANNHFHDYGDVGVKQTIDACNELQMAYCGGGMTLQEAQKPKTVTIYGRTISVVNFCENEFSVATNTSAGANPFDFVDIVYQIKRARNLSDYVLVFIHGGVEHYQLPTPMMVKTYRFLVEMGADVVVNSHQHCFNGFELYQGKPIVYGLGNFFFDNGAKSITKWNEGYMAMIEELDGIYTIIPIPYIQGLSNPTITLMKDQTSFNDKLEIINKTIQMPDELEKSFKKNVQSRKRVLLSHYEPYTSKVALKLYRKGLLPSFLSQKKRVLLLNRLRCESHRQVYSKLLSQTLGFPF